MKGILALLTLLLAGCITTDNGGGLPDPAPAGQRISAQLNLARGYLSESDWGRARVALNRALEIDKTHVETHVLLAALNEQQNEPELAEDHYKLALRYGPNDPQVLNNYGVFLLRNKRYEEALLPLRKLVKNPDYHLRAESYETLGIAEYQLKHLDRARAAFTRALVLKPFLPRSNLELSIMAFKDAEYGSAATYYAAFRQSARQTPRSLCYGMQLAAALEDQDQISSYQMALRNLYPNSREASDCRVPN